MVGLCRLGWVGEGLKGFALFGFFAWFWLRYCKATGFDGLGSGESPGRVGGGC